MLNLVVKVLGIGSEDNGFNWFVFELLWWDFFRCIFYVFNDLVLYNFCLIRLFIWFLCVLKGFYLFIVVCFVVILSFICGII